MEEIEVKFYVAELAALEARIRLLGGILEQARVEEINLRFDTPAGELGKGFRVLRLRQDTAAHLTYKGPGIMVEGVRQRQEIEFEVSSFTTARAFLEALGYQVYMIYEKFRTTYVLDGLHVLLDELPYGNFLEIEGMDAASIHAVSDRLGLQWEASVPASYTVLFDQLRERLQLSFTDLTFVNFSGLAVQAADLGVRCADNKPAKP